MYSTRAGTSLPELCCGCHAFKLSSFAWQDAIQVVSIHGTSDGMRALLSFGVIFGRLCYDT